MTDVHVGLNELGIEQLQLGVKLRKSVLGQQAQEVQTDKLVLVRRFGNVLPKRTKPSSVSARPPFSNQKKLRNTTHWKSK